MKKLYLAIALAFVTIFQAFPLTYYTTPIEVGAPDGEYLGYQYVDLGLPGGTLWAVYNIGTDLPEGAGDLFAWGEVEPKETFTGDNYEFFIGWELDDWGNYTRCFEDIGENISGTQYDAATYQWGEGWRMPTYQDYWELHTYCREDWDVNLNGMPGSLVIGRNGHKIFLPCRGEPKPFIGDEGPYWLAEVSKPTEAYRFRTVDNSNMGPESCLRYAGSAIRPVIDKEVVMNQQSANEGPQVSIFYRAGTLKIKGEGPEYRLRVADLSGSTMFEGNVKPGANSLPEFPSGTYLLSLYSDNSIVKTQKIAVK